MKAAELPRKIALISRGHLEAFLVERSSRHRPASLSVEFRALQQFWRWAVEEREVDVSPMARMRPPHVPEEPPATVTVDAQGVAISSGSRVFADFTFNLNGTVTNSATGATATNDWDGDGAHRDRRCR